MLFGILLYNVCSFKGVNVASLQSKFYNLFRQYSTWKELFSETALFPIQKPFLKLGDASDLMAIRVHQHIWVITSQGY